MSITITNVSLSPNAFTYGDAVTVTATVRNDGSGSVTGLCYYILDQAGSSHLILGNSGWGFNGTIGAGKSRTFTQVVTLNTANARAIQAELLAAGQRYRTGFRLNVHTRKGSTTEIVDAVAGLYNTKFFDEHKNARITALSVQRCLGDGTPDNEGTSASLTAGFELPEGFECVVGYGHGTIESEIELSAPVTNDVSALANNGAIFIPQYDYEFVMALTDGVETVRAATVLPAAFANLHLSGYSTGGVALGRFSRATLGNPLFECEYPASFYGGIEGVNLFSTAEVRTGGRWIDGKPLYRRTFRAYSPSSDATVATVPVGSGFAHIVDGTANYRYNGEGSYWAGNYYRAASDYLRFYVSDSEVKIGFGANLSVDTCWVTVEYTK